MSTLITTGVIWLDNGIIQQVLADIEKAVNMKTLNQRIKKAEVIVETRIKNFKSE